MAVAALADSGGFRKAEKAEHNKRLRKGLAKVITVIFDLWIYKCFLSCAWLYPSALPSLQPLPSWSLRSVTKMSSLAMMNIKIHPLTLQWGGVQAAPTSQPAVPPCQQIWEGNTTLVYPGFVPSPDSWLWLAERWLEFSTIQMSQTVYINIVPYLEVLLEAVSVGHLVNYRL